MVCDPCYNCLDGIAGEVIFAKIEVLETSLLGDELYKKVYVAKMKEPRWISSEVEISDGFDIGTEESFKNELSNVYISVSILTECIHIEKMERWIILDDLSEQTHHRQPSCLCQIRHAF